MAMTAADKKSKAMCDAVCKMIADVPGAECSEVAGMSMLVNKMSPTYVIVRGSWRIAKAAVPEPRQRDFPDTAAWRAARREWDRGIKERCNVAGDAAAAVLTASKVRFRINESYGVREYVVSSVPGIR